MIERRATITELPVGDVHVSQDRLRVTSEAKVLALMQVISEGVFLGAITVRRSGKMNILIDGAHRLEAARRLGLETIRVDLLDCSASEARRLEVSGNITAGMTPIQDAIFLGVYQEEYEKLHPETKRGMAGALAKHGLQANNFSFAELVAETRQITPRQVQKIIAAGRSLSRIERVRLQSVEHRIPLNEIVKLGKIGDDDLREKAVDALAEGKPVSAVVAAAKGHEAPQKDPVEEAFQALMKAWARAPMAARRRFAHEAADDLTALEGGGE